MGTTKKFTEDQLRAMNPDLNVWVQANAGTGKTEVLTGRLLRIFLRHINTEKSEFPGVLCLTFTKAGAGEMRLRIMQSIREWAMLPDDELRQKLEELLDPDPVSDELLQSARKIFYYYIDNSDVLKTKTIHSFCEEILKRFSMEAGLGPSWTVIQDSAQKILLEKAFERLVNNKNADVATMEAFEKILEYKTENDISKLYALLAERHKSFFNVDMDKYRKHFESVLKEKLNIQPNFVDAYICDKQKLEQIRDKYEENIKKGVCAATFKKALECLNAFIEDPSDFDTYKSIFLTANGEISNANGKPKVFEASFDEAERVKAFNQNRINYHAYKDTMTLFDLSVAFMKHYNKIKQEQNVLDFNDLILHTVKLFSDASVMGWVLSRLDSQIRYILVDEAQDTNAKQWSIFKNLIESIKVNADAISLVVGDSKQAIFGFQGSEPEAFEDSREYFEEKLKEEQLELPQSTLKDNFRSLSPILNTVDYVFYDNVIKKDMFFVNNQHISNRSRVKKEKGGIVEIHDLFRDETLKGTKLKQAYADYITKEIQRIIDDGICEDDIMILVRDRTEVIHKLIKNLKDRHINVAGADKIELPTYPVIRDLLNLVRFCIDTTDNYSLCCVLKSPLYRLSEEEIYDLCQEWKRLVEIEKEKKKQYGEEHYKKIHVFDVLKEKYPVIYNEMFGFVNDARISGPYTFFSNVLNFVSKYSDKNIDNRGQMVANFGEHIIDPLEEFINICLSYERTQSGTMRDFLKWFITGGSTVKREMDNAKGVKIITVHSSKGLAAKVVMLIDTMTKPSKDKSDKNSVITIKDKNDNKYEVWLWDTVSAKEKTPELISLKAKYKEDVELAEHYRLLYVAMTRPRDRLYIYGLAGGGKNANKETKEDSKEWHPNLWRILSDIATKVPSAKIDESTIRITDDDEFEEFFEREVKARNGD